MCDLLVLKNKCCFLLKLSLPDLDQAGEYPGVVWVTSTPLKVSVGFTFIGKENITKYLQPLLSPPTLEYLVRSNFNGLGGKLETGVDSGGDLTQLK